MPMPESTMAVMHNASEVPSASSARSTARFGARAVLAGTALALVAVPFALTLVLVEEKWGPLLRIDVGATACMDMRWPTRGSSARCS